jgi:hypothetical protein
LRKERRLRKLENRVLRRIFGPKRDAVTGEWRKLHNQELHNLYSPTIVRVIKWKNNEMAGACSSDGKERGVYRVLFEKPRVKETTGELQV